MDRRPNYISDHAANACIYTALAVCLVFGLLVSYALRKSKHFLEGNGTRTALPLAFNFIASGKSLKQRATGALCVVLSGVAGRV